MYDQNTLAALHQGYLGAQSQKQQAKPAPQKKGNILTNILPAVGGGLGAIAGIPLDFLGGAGSIAGATVGSSLGEALKEHLLGQSLSAKQIGIQGVEGGALSAFSPLKLAKGASAATKGFVTAGADTAGKAATADTGSQLAKNLVTQGQAAQGRVAGVSAGKVGQSVITPQDTAQYLQTLKSEGIKTGNANNTLRDVQGKLNQYGKQISDHFTTNNTPLNPADTKTIAANYLTGLKTTDPGVLKQANILANDLEKNVSDTKSLWQFRTRLDDAIPAGKQGTTLAVSNKIQAVKGLRQFIAGQLGDIPGASNYHALSDIKPLVAAEANRLNNPSGGVLGRVAASGPVQKTEALLGQGVEKVGQKLGGSPANLTDALTQASDVTGQAGTEAGLPAASRASQALQFLKNAGTLPARAAAAPLAYPGRSIAQVGKQVIGRGAGEIAGSIGAAQQQPAQNTQSTQTPANLTDALIGAGQGDQSSQQSQSPYTQEDLQYDLQRDPTNATKYINYYQSLDKIYGAAAAPKLNASQIQQANNANSALSDLQSISQMIQQNPNLVTKGSIPGSSNSVVQRLTGTTDYEAAKSNIVDVISRLRSGAAISASEEKLYKSLLPSAGDTSQSANSKLQRLSSLFQSFAAPQSQPAASDLSSALMQAGYGQ